MGRGGQAAVREEGAGKGSIGSPEAGPMSLGNPALTWRREASSSIYQ